MPIQPTSKPNNHAKYTYPICLPRCRSSTLASMMTQIGLTATPSKIALSISTAGCVGNQMTKNKLPKANRKPNVSTTLVPKRLSINPITKLVTASEIKCTETANDVIPTATEVAVGNIER